MIARSVTVTAADWDALQGAIEGAVVLPGTVEYETARKPAIPRFGDARPQAVVRCATAADVAETIAFARQANLPIAARSGGHCFAGRSSTTGIVLDVSPLNAVTVAAGSATVGAGARLADVYDALDRHGVTIAGGCGPTVGIAGLTLGGGLGVLGRMHGLTSDALRAAEVVLADGSVVRCDEQREQELLWALRGGGGRVGVVTALELATVPAPATTTFHLDWPFERAASVVAAWQEWAPAGPDELAASLHVAAAHDPARPPTVTVFGAFAGGERAAGGLLDELVAAVGSSPVAAASAHLPYREAKRHLAAVGEQRERGAADPDGHLYVKSQFFRSALPAEAVAALVANVAEGRAADHSRKLDFMAWGGAYNRVAPDATAFPHRAERFLLAHDAVVDAGASPAAGRAWLARSWSIAQPHSSGGAYANFPDPDLADEADAYFGANRARLERAVRRYDPDGVLARSA